MPSLFSILLFSILLLTFSGVRCKNYLVAQEYSGYECAGDVVHLFVYKVGACLPSIYGEGYIMYEKTSHKNIVNGKGCTDEDCKNCRPSTALSLNTCQGYGKFVLYHSFPTHYNGTSKIYFEEPKCKEANMAIINVGGAATTCESNLCPAGNDSGKNFVFYCSFPHELFKKGISGGAIVGIVLTLAVGVVLGICVYIYLRNRRQQRLDRAREPERARLNEQFEIKN